MNVSDLIESMRIGCRLVNNGRRWDLIDPCGCLVAHVAFGVILILEASGAAAFEWRDYGAEIVLK